MKHSQLMKKIKEGRVEVMAWMGTGCGDSQYADLMVWPNDLSKRPTRKVVEITNMPSSAAHRQ